MDITDFGSLTGWEVEGKDAVLVRTEGEVQSLKPLIRLGYGLNYAPPSTHPPSPTASPARKTTAEVRILTSSTWEWDLIWKQSVYRQSR